MARMWKSGAVRYVYTDVVDGDTFVIPKGFVINYIAVDTVTLVGGGAITVGTTDGGNDIVESVSLPNAGVANGILLTLVTKAFASETTCTINISNASVANVYVLLQKYTAS